MREDVDRLKQRLVMHQPDAHETQHVGDFVRIVEHGRRAVGHDGSGKLGRRQHAALDVHVAVAETWNHVASPGIDDPSIVADRV